MKKISSVSFYALPGIPKDPIPSLHSIWNTYTDIVCKRYLHVLGPKSSSSHLNFVRKILPLTPFLLQVKGRNSGLVYIKCMFLYYVKTKYGKHFTLESMAEVFDYDHTTVIHCINKFQDLLDIDSAMPSGLSHININTVEDYQEVKKLMDQ